MNLCVQIHTAFVHITLSSAVLGLRRHAGFSPVAVSGGYSLVTVFGLLTVVVSLLEHGI